MNAEAHNPRSGRKHFLFARESWLEHRAAALSPRVVTDLVTTDESRREFLRGMLMLRLFGERAIGGRQPHPQQLLIADMLAAGRSRNAVLISRRSTKSTSPIAVGLGRAEGREDYRFATLTLTSGKAGRSRFLKDVAPAFERSELADRGKVYRGAGSERIEFPDGGFAAWLSSIDDLRGEAFDMILLDEAGEPDPEKVVDAIGAALPTLDTRPGAQIVVAGTAGRYRDTNLLWDWLNLDPERAGIVNYSVPQDTQLDDLVSWEVVEPLVRAVHPGVHSGLTTLEVVRANFDVMPLEVFAREYLSLFGELGQATLLFDRQKWAQTGVDDLLPEPPSRFSLAFACHPDGTSTSIVAAWRDEKGRAVPLLVDRIAGIEKAAPTLIRLARRYRVPVTYDAGSQNAGLIVERLNRASPRPKMDPRTYPHVKQAASLVVDEVARGNVVHYAVQADLTHAVQIAVKRRSGDRAWLLGRDPKRPDDDITPAEAWSLAQLAYDTTKPKAVARGRVAA